MSGQLDQILAYLDRPGVTEIVVGSGRPIMFRRNQENVGLTKEPLSKTQLATLLKGSPLADLMPTTEGTKPVIEISVGTRAVKVTVSRRGDDVAFRIEKGEPAFELELSPEISKRAKRTTAGVHPVAAGELARTSMRMPVVEETTRSQPIPLATQQVPVERAASVGVSGAAPTSFQGLIAAATQRNASDLHIATNRPISIRVLGELVPLDPAATPVTASQADGLLKPLLSKEQLDQLASVGYVDLAIQAPGGGRLRTNISRFQGGLKGTFRIARLAPATLDELNLPRELEKHVHHHQGLIIVAGPSGHGKTTTLAALVDLVNASRPFHIITVEDPIEIVYPRKAAVVSQREVGPHTRSFAAALKGSLREDPDVIVIGELRDRETVEIALTAAETGHLVIATISTPSAAKTIDRLVDMFPPEDQSQVRSSIAGALRAIISQRLVPSSAGDGIYPAVEVLTGVLALSAMIREDKLFQLPNLMQRGKAFGMIRFDDSLMELVRAGRITHDVAIATSENKKELAAQLRAGSGVVPVVKPPEPAKRGGLGGLFGRKDS